MRNVKYVRRSSSSRQKEQLKERLSLKLTTSRYGVFLSSPFRGTDLALTAVHARATPHRVSARWFAKTVTDNLAALAIRGYDFPAQNPLGALYLQNGASQLSDKSSSLFQLTKDIRINDRITYHSIIANNDADITRGLAEMVLAGAKARLVRRDK